jgi:hypothetical protein
MLTYGTNSYIPFKKGKHPENKKVVMDGQELCEDCGNAVCMLFCTYSDSERPPTMIMFLIS